MRILIRLLIIIINMIRKCYIKVYFSIWIVTIEIVGSDGSNYGQLSKIKGVEKCKYLRIILNRLGMTGDLIQKR